jgi:hypothetical protein
MGEELVRNFSGKRAYVQGSFCGSRTLRISVLQYADNHALRATNSSATRINRG